MASSIYNGASEFGSIAIHTVRSSVDGFIKRCSSNFKQIGHLQKPTRMNEKEEDEPRGWRKRNERVEEEQQKKRKWQAPVNSPLRSPFQSWRRKGN
jgi:hypothetical protein